MGRYETLNPDTQDQVNAIIPAIAKAYKVDNVKDIIPEEIRMRPWDCERRDHIKDQTEDDPRNWGVQFLKDMQAIGRLVKGDLDTFQKDLRAQVAKHAKKHPWCKLSDIKELKTKYQNPGAPSEPERSPDEYVSDDASSNDSYFEELVEPELLKGKRRRRGHEVYEVRGQKSSRKKVKRVSSASGVRRESKSSGRDRREKSACTSMVPRSADSRETRGYSNTAHLSVEQNTPVAGRVPVRRRQIVESESGESHVSAAHDPYIQPDVPIESLRLQAELDVAEAELKAARLRLLYVEAKERAKSREKSQASLHGYGTHDSPQSRPY